MYKTIQIYHFYPILSPVSRTIWQSIHKLYYVTRKLKQSVVCAPSFAVIWCFHNGDIENVYKISLPTKNTRLVSLKN